MAIGNARKRSIPFIWILLYFSRSYDDDRDVVMARFKLKLTPFDHALDGLKSDHLASIYFLMGEDQFLQQWFVQKVTKAMFREDPAEKMVLLPDELGSKEIIDHLNATDLFNAKKLFILRNPNGLKGKARDELVDYCNAPNTGNTLILVHDEYGAKNKMMEALATAVNPISCATPFSNEMVKWANGFFKENGVSTVPKSMIDNMIELAGDSLNHLKNEIDKLAISIDDNTNLNDIDLSQFSGWKRKYRQYEFFNYLGNRKLKESLELGRALVSQDTTMINLLYPLTEFFQELLYLKISPGTIPTYKGFTKLSPSVNRQLPNYANHYTSKEITLAIKRLGRIDAQLKTSRIQDESAITEFVYATIVNG